MAAAERLRRTAERAAAGHRNRARAAAVAVIRHRAPARAHQVVAAVPLARVAVDAVAAAERHVFAAGAADVAAAALVVLVVDNSL